MCTHSRRMTSSIWWLRKDLKRTAKAAGYVSLAVRVPFLMRFFFIYLFFFKLAFPSALLPYREPGGTTRTRMGSSPSKTRTSLTTKGKGFWDVYGIRFDAWYSDARRMWFDYEAETLVLERSGLIWRSICTNEVRVLYLQSRLYYIKVGMAVWGAARRMWWSLKSLLIIVRHSEG